MEKDGACKMDRQNKKCSCARKSGRRKNNAGTVKKNCLLKDALKGMVNGNKFRGRRRYMIDNIVLNRLYAYTKRKTEKRAEWRMLSLQ